MLDAINFQEHEHTHAQNRFAVIPTADKLNADLKFTGKGVCIAFLDSGFYPHADFAERVVAFHDVSGEEKSFQFICEPKDFHWHGTQTVTACAGNGALSDGVYRGIASDAELVLVKVSNKGRISDESIEKGLLWVLENREKYRIRVLNMSLGGDMDVSFAESRINQLAEELIKQGVCITVAAGNSADSHSIPPANSPSVITVGGFSDENQFSNDAFELYHSNFGATIDGLIKPEIIAPAMNIAAPILPNTEDYKIAETLSLIASAPDYAFRNLLEQYWEKAALPDDIIFHGNGAARSIIDNKLRERKIVATHYQNVDGTSFAAPITASVIAQMLEANPNLTPAIIKNILISTASRLTNFPAIRQGFGVLNTKLAVGEGLKEIHFFDHETLTAPRIEGERIIFFYHDDNAETVYLAGDFNNWSSSENQFVKNADGLWHAAISSLPSGKYLYKFVVDGNHWVEDRSNGMKEKDSFDGFNSVLQIA
jgi:serine protease AprX